MKPETADYLRKARRTLQNAKEILVIDLHDVAAREAYLSAFHAAEAYIFELADKTTKTHRGLRTSFSQLAKDDARMPSHFPRFLADAYELKSISDYGLDPSQTISGTDAVSAIEMAEHFVTTIEDLLK
jgi:uncharacterized protein (UPF0332 family)